MRTDVLCVRKRLARPRHRSLVPLVLTHGVVQRAILVAQRQDNAAWMGIVARMGERRFVCLLIQMVHAWV